jgi:asparagine synthase (glutamine-hydrolysing)
MLWTTPESLNEELPLEDCRGDLVITADARIDNREELVGALSLGDRLREEISDSDLILGAYEKWGEDSPRRLTGDFAFAIWDKRKRQLFCARDCMGIRPFYYFLSNKVFAFASEIEALLRVPEVPQRLNEVRVADLLVHNIADKTATFYEDVLRLVPAHSMTVGRHKTKTERFWTLDPTRELHLRSNEEYAEAFREVFAEAVRCRLRSAFPVGSELSGGLDSSSVACMARDLLVREAGNRRLHTVSAVFNEAPESDESAFIDSVIAGGGFEPHKVQVELLSPLLAPRRVLWDADEPSILAGLSMPWGLAQEASREGVRVLLNGYEGDLVVSHGITRLAELASTGHWRKLASEIDAFSTTTEWSRQQILRTLVLRPLAPDWLLGAWAALHGRAPWNRTQSMYSGAIREDFARLIGLSDRVEALTSMDEEVPDSVGPSRRSHYEGFLHGANQYGVEIHGRIGASLAVENRYPFYDRRLMEFCLALPPEQKMSGGYTRAILRRAMADVLPDKIRWRQSKGNLTPGLSWSLIMFDRKLVEGTIFDEPGSLEKYADVDKLRQAYVRCAYSAGSSRASAGDALSNIRSVGLALWLRRAGFS